MKFVGVDLHKQTIMICVVDQSRTVLERKRLLCADESAIARFFENLGAFRAVVEATASYEWFVRLIEPFAEKVLLAHPKKLRVIAESTRKSDKLDAQVLAEFLALDMIPTSYRPTPRQRDHRRLVRQRDSVQRRITSVKNRMRRMMADDNADRRDLFSQAGLASLKDFAFSSADCFAMTQRQQELAFLRQQLQEADGTLRSFARQAAVRERQLRELLQSVPGVGFVTAEVVLAEIADIDRFDSQKQVVAYAGLAPGQRESGGRSKELHIEKTGSRHLRWILVEAAWRLVRHSPRWRAIYENLKRRLRAKKAIVAVARRLLCLMTALLKSGEPYSAVHPTGRSGSANGGRPIVTVHTPRIAQRVGEQSIPSSSRNSACLVNKLKAVVVNPFSVVPGDAIASSQTPVFAGSPGCERLPPHSPPRHPGLRGRRPTRRRGERGSPPVHSQGSITPGDTRPKTSQIQR